jgi:hypothetical protein
MSAAPTGYPVQFTIDYPDHPLNRLTSAFRIFTVIPIAIVLSALAHYTSSSGTWENGDSAGSSTWQGASFGGLLVLAPALMIIFREKYPRWWFDFNFQLLSFMNRVGAYFVLLTDVYPATDEEQVVHLVVPYPDVKQDLNRWLPIVKWFLAIPHYFILFFLYIAAFFCVIAAWFAILFTGRYPKGLFDFIVGVGRWGNRVTAYALILSTDKYPPFSTNP